MTARIVVFLTVALLSSCVTPQSVPGLTGPNLSQVRNECIRLRCEEPNGVVARYFAMVAEKTGGACVVHVFPRSGSAPWRYWEEYLAPLRPLLARSDVRLYAHGIERDTASGARGRKRVIGLRSFYSHQYADAPRIVRRGVPTKAVLPPYRDPYCHGSPVLEVLEGARLVSERASPLPEGVTADDRAKRTVLVVIESGRGEQVND